MTFTVTDVLTGIIVAVIVLGSVIWELASTWRKK